MAKLMLTPLTLQAAMWLRCPWYSEERVNHKDAFVPPSERPVTPAIKQVVKPNGVSFLGAFSWFDDD